MRIFAIWSKVNQAFLICFGNPANGVESLSVLRTVSTQREVDSLLKEWGIHTKVQKVYLQEFTSPWPA